MPAAPLPVDEAARLADLHELGLLDTAEEDLFDSFTRVAAELFDAPIAAVSLVDADRQYFKSIQGLAVRGTSRDLSFCAHAILRPDEVMVVADAADDPRFADNALVTGDPGIRFYAGAPVMTEKGHAIGALCVIDRQPRQVLPRAQERLRDLARGVSAAVALRRALRQVSMAALTDPLTGLSNRKALAHALETAGPDYAMLMFDLDRFKSINDTFGHGGGDGALVEVAARLRAATRPEDLLFRLGGDEFCAMVRGVRDPAVADRVAGGIHAALARPFSLGGTPVPLRTSIGHAVRVAGAPDGAVLLERADAALYAAKRAGRGVTRSAEALSAGPGIGRQALEAALHAAFAPGAEVPFQLWFQPIAALGDARVTSVEALLRWTCDGQAVAPADVLPLIESLGYSGALDRWAVGEACRAAAVLPGIAVAVNVSAASFGVPGFAASVLSRLAMHQLPGDRLMIEMTESALAGDAVEALAQVAELAAAGVRVCLDDFGGGHGTLARMRRFPFARVKLDRSLVDGCEVDSRSATLVEAVGSVAEALDIEAVAEGVENEAQLRLLAERRVMLAQGHLLSPAVPLADLPAAMAGASAIARRVLGMPALALAA
ncbi:putative bifunctional diguanylate cyclase/phosphodiesterase [Roseomonas sp. CCTCC AB2023176]|uniref:putative bifunctional diguanylate cyclase/phosphodiesterase n=1 Tax=Roseomonas sp. CCTCC AB2023176 TaxID=3342640 RepID=UPI0035E0D301